MIKDKVAVGSKEIVKVVMKKKQPIRKIKNTNDKSVYAISSESDEECIYLSYVIILEVDNYIKNYITTSI